MCKFIMNNHGIRIATIRMNVSDSLLPEQCNDYIHPLFQVHLNFAGLASSSSNSSSSSSDNTGEICGFTRLNDSSVYNREQELPCPAPYRLNPPRKPLTYDNNSFINNNSSGMSSLNLDTLHLRSCIGRCCLPCPYYKSFYPPNQFDPYLTLFETTRVVSTLVALFLVISFAVLPGKRNQPVVTVLFFTLAAFIWQAAVIYTEKCLCGVQGIMAILGGLATKMWCSFLILNLHMYIVWESNFLSRHFIIIQIICWGVPLVLTSIAALSLQIEYHIGATCTVSPSIGAEAFIYPSAIILYPFFILHIFTFAYILKVVIQTRIRSTASFKLTPPAALSPITTPALPPPPPLLLGDGSNVDGKGFLLTFPPLPPPPPPPKQQQPTKLYTTLKLQWRPLVLALFFIILFTSNWLTSFVEIKRATASIKATMIPPHDSFVKNNSPPTSSSSSEHSDSFHKSTNSTMSSSSSSETSEKAMFQIGSPPTKNHVSLYHSKEGEAAAEEWGEKQNSLWVSHWIKCVFEFNEVGANPTASHSYSFLKTQSLQQQQHHHLHNMKRKKLLSSSSHQYTTAQAECHARFEKEIPSFRSMAFSEFVTGLSGFLFLSVFGLNLKEWRKFLINKFGYGCGGEKGENRVSLARAGGGGTNADEFIGVIGHNSSSPTAARLGNAVECGRTWRFSDIDDEQNTFKRKVMKELCLDEEDDFSNSDWNHSTLIVPAQQMDDEAAGDDGSHSSSILSEFLSLDIKT